MQRPLRVMLGNTGEAPYAETAPADILATFHHSVLGSLLKLTDSYNLEPGLIQRWQWDPVDKSYVFDLRQDIYFHNGRKASAADLEFSLLRGFFSKHRSFYQCFLRSIQGLSIAKSHKKYATGLVSGVKISGDYQIRVQLDYPDPSFVALLTLPYFSLVPREALSGDNINWKDVPVGAGPFRVSSKFDVSTGKTVLLRVNKRSTLPNKIELYTRKPEKKPDVSLWKLDYLKPYYTDKSISVFCLFFVNVNSVARNMNFRKALHVGINRSELASGLKAFVPTFELLPRQFWGRANLKDPYNLPEAKKLLAMVPKEEIERSLQFLVYGGSTLKPGRRAVLERLKSQLAGLGISIDLVPTNEKFLQKKTAVQSTIYIAGRIVSYQDPLLMFETFGANSPFKYTSVDDPVFQKKYVETQRSENAQERKDRVQELSRYFNEKKIAIPLLEQKQVFYMNSATVKSLGTQIDPLFINLDEVKLREAK